jgi:hypothetical protein
MSAGLIQLWRILNPLLSSFHFTFWSHNFSLDIHVFEYWFPFIFYWVPTERYHFTKQFVIYGICMIRDESDEYMMSDKKNYDYHQPITIFTFQELMIKSLSLVAQVTDIKIHFLFCWDRFPSDEFEISSETGNEKKVLWCWAYNQCLLQCFQTMKSIENFPWELWSTWGW